MNRRLFITAALLFTLVSCASHKESAGLAPCQTLMGDYDKQCLEENKERKTQLVDSFIEENPSQAKYREYAIVGLVEIGMAQELTLISYGRPIRVNDLASSYGAFRQFVYPTENVYMRDGIVDAIQTRR